FEKLVKGIPGDGLIVINADDEGIARVLREATKEKVLEPRLIRYGKNASADYSYDNVRPSKSGLQFDVTHKGKKTCVISPMFGRFNAENIAAAFAMASEIGVPTEKIVAAINDFKGIKRRFEKRLEGDVTVFDCHAPTPDKVASVLASLREVYDKKIIAIFEPNIGGRERASAAKYDGAFKDADTVIIPRLTKLKISDEKEAPMEGAELAETISKTHKNCALIEDDEKIVQTAVSQAKKDDIIVFLGSHGFRGMIEETVEKFLL
ncbi:MAG: Mur ligase family protein, partial [Candidatus Pacebacteria bacterium]|nr:Mur ligase family protein [Candidatus Paceibacterota bacterium]